MAADESKAFSALKWLVHIFVIGMSHADGGGVGTHKTREMPRRSFNTNKFLTPIAVLFITFSTARRVKIFMVCTCYCFALFFGKYSADCDVEFLCLRSSPTPHHFSTSLPHSVPVCTRCANIGHLKMPRQWYTFFCSMSDSDTLANKWDSSFWME